MPTILVADDDSAILALAAMVLQRDGHHVLRASNGLEALMLYNSYAPHIDLIITDYDMPQMNGAELASRIRARNPSVKVIMMSGFMPSGVAGAGRDYPVLKKPFRPAELREAVQKILSPPA